MKMKTTLLSAAAICVAYAGGANAASIDFTDAFTVVTPSAIPSAPLVITEVSEGVTFTISATARGVDRFVQGSNGLNFGIPGNGMNSLSLVANQDVSFTGFTGRDNFATLTGSPSYEALIGGVLASSGNGVTGSALTGYSFNSGPLALSAGQSFLFQPEAFGVLIGGAIASLEFEVAAVPLPAGLPMMLAGLGLLGLKRKRG